MTEVSPASTAKFLTGSTMRHILVMTGSTTAGLISIFIVDFINLYFLSLLGEVEITAAIGYAGTIIFFTISVGIGLAIAATALISPAIGRMDFREAERLTVNTCLYTVAVTTVFAGILWVFTPQLLTALGAEGRTHEIAVSYLRIIIPSTPLLALGMCAAAILRSLGDAKRSMYVTFFGALANAALDPLLIFGLGLGVEGAAMATVLSRVVLVATGFYGVVTVHGLVSGIRAGNFRADARAATSIAIPALLTNIATPVGNAYVTWAIAGFGDSAVAAWAIIGRLIPLAFAGVFALSGAVGPIVGQNYGGRAFPRIRQSLTDALIFTGVYTAAAWLALSLFHDTLAVVFKATPETAALLKFFCYWLTPLFAFLGALFVANAALNNLGKPQLSAKLNWGRATLGTVPFVMAGAHLFGAAGVIAGNVMGAVFFGVLSVLLCYRHINALERAALTKPEPRQMDGVEGPDAATGKAPHFS